MLENKGTKRMHSIHTLYAMAFLFALSNAIPGYINSTFLAGFIPENYVGLMFTIGAGLAIIGLVLGPHILRRLGNFKTTMMFLVLGILAFAGLAFLKSVFAIIPLFLVYSVVSRLLFYNHDLMLESFSNDDDTGGIRGANLSISNIAWVIAPTIAGFVIGESSYWRVYLLSAIALALLLPIITYNFKGYHDPEYKLPPILKKIKEIYRNRDLRKLFQGYLLLRFFYSWMVIYTPIYLHQHIGFSWSTIGLIFTVMLLPFVLLEYPLGRVADSKLGEKELMSAGFVVMAISTIALAFMGIQPAWVWAAALFMTRVGASTVQVMSETYFFKKVSSADPETLSIFRMTGPISYLVSPLIASIILSFIDIRFLYVILGVLMLWGLRYSLTIKDTL